MAKAYGTDAYFYTIGLGMVAGSKDSISRSISSDIYKTAVLNPTAANIAALSTTSGQTTTTQSNTADRNIAPYTEETSTMLQQLLNNTATPANNQWIKSSGGTNYAYVEHLARADAVSMGSPNATTGPVPIISNPYAGNYRYTDGASFTNNPTAEDLAAIYESAIESAGKTSVYGFILKDGKPAEISDVIGDGMEMKSEPVLNYGGVNYAPVSHETKSDGTIVYHYKGTYIPKDANGKADGSGTEIDLSKVTAEVKPDATGNQVVTLKVPEEAMPTYKQCVDVNGDTQFYYEDLPVRLIYQVGLTEESEKEVRALAETGGEKTFYTNKDADSEFKPVDTKNPYYEDNDYDKNPLVKTDNTTDTDSNAWTYDPSSDAGDVKEDLGNNGKLEFKVEKQEIKKASFVLNKVNDTGNLITESEATFDLYTDENLTDKVGSYTTQDGVLRITDLEIGQTYYLVETVAPEGFNKLDGVIKLKVNGENEIEVQSMTDMASYADGILTVKNSSGYELPETGGIGTKILYSIGGILVVAAIIVLVTRKRMDDDK